MFFAADDGRKGSELWISNGSKNGTELAADIQRGEEGSSPSDLLTQGNMLYLSADDGIHGRELWAYNIKSGQHQLVRDIRTGSRVGSNPSELTSLNGQIFFAAEDDIYGRELWCSGGTKSSTKMVLDINPGGFSSDPKDLSLLNGNLYFTGTTYFNGVQILKLDGSGLNVTEIIGSLDQATAAKPSDLHASRDQLFFSAETTLDPNSEPTPSTPSAEGGSTSGDPGGFMIAAQGLSAEALEDIENYNERIDFYRESDNLDEENQWIGSARIWANSLANSNDNPDSSLAKDWNQYFRPLFLTHPNLPLERQSKSQTASPPLQPDAAQPHPQVIAIFLPLQKPTTIALAANSGSPMAKSMATLCLKTSIQEKAVPIPKASPVWEQKLISVLMMVNLEKNYG